MIFWKEDECEGAVKELLAQNPGPPRGDFVQVARLRMAWLMVCAEVQSAVARRGSGEDVEP